jgi:TDG/mug DNA glycosylase family protein
MSRHTAPVPDPAAPPDLTLPDILAPGLDVVFVGINPSLSSAERGQYFARPSNAFWRLLSASGLVPERLGPADGPRLPTFGIGLTDIVKRATHDAAALSVAEFAAGREALREKLLRYRPAVVCFVGKLAWRRFHPGANTPFGRQRERIGDTAVFVMPSTSGRVNHLHAERLRCLAELRAFLGR